MSVAIYQPPKHSRLDRLGGDSNRAGPVLATARFGAALRVSLKIGRLKMNEEGKRALKIFLEFGLLIVLLAGFNLYNYFSGGSKLFLVVGIICVLGFVGWALFYLFYVRRSGE